MAPSEHAESDEEEEDFSQSLLYDPRADSGSEFELENPRKKDWREKARNKRKTRDVGDGEQAGTVVLTHRPKEPKSTASKSKTRTRPAKLSASKFNAKKRKASGPSTTSDRAEKRQRLSPSDRYRRLLNHEIERIVSPKLPKTNLKTSQIGSSTWTALEKSRFFAAASRYGRYDYSSIASKIRSKSVYEVADYAEVLQKALDDRLEGKIRHEKRYWVNTDEIPAALEVGVELEEVMEAMGDELARKEQMADYGKEVKRWGDDVTVLTEGADKWMRSDLRDKKGKKGDRRKVLLKTIPSIELLELQNWLSTSRNVFMNPAGEAKKQENWREIIKPEDGDEHGIYASAFSDFHTLAIGLTKRLVSASLFFAMQRLRASDMKIRSKNRQPRVQPRDVKAAVRAMGLKDDSYEFWRESARRNHLDVVDDEKGGREMSIEEVERVLAETVRGKKKRHMGDELAELQASVSTAVETQSEGDSTDSISSSDSGSNSDSNSSDSESEAETHPASGAPPGRPKQAATSAPISPEEQHDRYLESFDHYHSLRAEARLWALLEQEPPFAINVKAARAKVMPRMNVKDNDEMETAKWRETTEKWADWEQECGVPAEVEFKKMREFRESDENRATKQGAGEERNEKRAGSQMVLSTERVESSDDDDVEEEEDKEDGEGEEDGESDSDGETPMPSPLRPSSPPPPPRPRQPTPKHPTQVGAQASKSESESENDSDNNHSPPAKQVLQTREQTPRPRQQTPRRRAGTPRPAPTQTSDSDSSQTPLHERTRPISSPPLPATLPLSSRQRRTSTRPRTTPQTYDVYHQFSQFDISASEGEDRVVEEGKKTRATGRSMSVRTESTGINLLPTSSPELTRKRSPDLTRTRRTMAPEQAGRGRERSSSISASQQQGGVPFSDLTGANLPAGLPFSDVSAGRGSSVQLPSSSQRRRRKEETQQERTRYASPVFSSTQLDALIGGTQGGTQRGELPGFGGMEGSEESEYKDD